MYAPWKLTGCGATGIEPDFALMKFKTKAEQASSLLFASLEDFEENRVVAAAIAGW
jgi:hypothetical protein